MTDKVRPIKQESSGTGGNPSDDVEYLNSPANPNQDALEARGYFIQNNSSSDTNVIVSRDASNNMTFTDPVAGSYTLTQLSTGGSGVPYNDFLLDCEPNSQNYSYSISYSGNYVSNETYTRTVGSTTAKTIDYTYTGSKVNTETRRVYNNTGVSVLAQMTITYSYTGNKVTGATYVRDI